MKQHSALCRCLLLVLALCLGLTQAACAQEVPELLEPVSVQLDTYAASVGLISKLEMYDASVIPYVEEMHFSQEGVISEVHVVIGQQVKAGDLLISLNQDADMKQKQALEEQIEVLETDAFYDEQLVAIDLAILEVELRALQNALTPDETAIELKKLEMEELRLNKELEASLRDLQLTELRGKLTDLEEKLGQNAIYAPFDGRVMYMAELSRGSYVGAYAPLIYLADDSRLSLRSTYVSSYALDNAQNIYAIIGANRYTVTPVEMDTAAYAAMVFSGEELTTTFTIDAPDEGISSGMYAAVCIESQRVEGALQVPSNVLYQGDGVRYLYVMKDGVRVRRDVKTGVSNGIMTQITEGLEEGELVYVKE